MNNKKLVIKFILLKISYWSYVASFTNYITSYFTSLGVSSSILSLIIVSYLICSFVGLFFWPKVCDRFKTNKKVFALCSIIGVISAFCLFETAGKSMIAVVFYMILGFAVQPLSTNLDSWILKSVDKTSKIFGRISVCGTLSYAAVVLFCGKLIELVGYKLMLIVGLPFLLMACVVALLTPEGNYTQEQEVQQSGNVKELFAIKPYMQLLILVFMSAFACTPVVSLKTVLLNEVGGNVSHIGIDSFVGLIVQAPFIASAGSIRKIKLQTRYLIITLSLFMMLVLDYFATAPIHVVIGSAFYNVAHGLLFGTMREVTEKYVPLRLINRGHGLMDAINGSLASMMGLLITSCLLVVCGLKNVILLGAVVEFLTVIIAFIEFKREKEVKRV